jgi:hypothetical protein
MTCHLGQRKREKIRTLERQVQSTMIEESSDAQGEGLQASQPYNIASDGYTADIGTDPASCADAVGLWSNSICQSSSCRNNSPPTPPLSGRGDSGTIAIRQGAPIPFGTQTCYYTRHHSRNVLFKIEPF